MNRKAPEEKFDFHCKDALLGVCNTCLCACEQVHKRFDFTLGRVSWQGIRRRTIAWGGQMAKFGR